MNYIEVEIEKESQLVVKCTVIHIAKHFFFGGKVSDLDNDTTHFLLIHMHGVSSRPKKKRRTSN